ncbi:hypothetical protein LL3_02083 [Bacillus amyloliquefaciens LL3]|nr:hypothetical protein LL3_02083 [Bacillus amyloliquefaciens LL3]
MVCKWVLQKLFLEKSAVYMWIDVFKAARLGKGTVSSGKRRNL